MWLLIHAGIKRVPGHKCQLAAAWLCFPVIGEAAALQIPG